MKSLIATLGILASMAIFMPAQSDDEATKTTLQKLEQAADRRSAVSGNINGETVLFEFFDYNCPFCRKGSMFLTDILPDYPHLKVIPVEVPSLSQDSIAATNSMLRIKDGEEYIILRDRIMKTSRRADGDLIDSISTRAGFELHDQTDFIDQVDKNFDLKENMLGAKGVPIFYIEGQIISGHKPLKLERAICASAPTPLCDSYRLLIDDASNAVKVGDVEEGRRLIALAADKLMASDSKVDHNKVCWRGAKMGAAEAVLAVCNQAVALAPEDSNARGSRSVARAIAGNLPGAIEDMEAALNLKQGDRKISNSYFEKRTAALKQMRKGNNPFADDKFLANY